MATDSTCTVEVEAPTGVAAWEKANRQITDYSGHGRWLQVSAKVVVQDTAEPDESFRVTLTAAIDQGELEWGY